jgi:hypothetical protein
MPDALARRIGRFLQPIELHESRYLAHTLSSKRNVPNNCL